MTHWLRNQNTFVLMAVLASIFILTACSTDLASPQPTALSGLTPYHTSTPAPTPILVFPATPTPIPTSTPIIYKISPNDTLTALARRFGVTVEALLSANPGVIPESLTIGQTITIPNTDQPSDFTLLITPVPLDLGPGLCQISITGTTCIVPVHNPYTWPLENIQADMTLFDENGLVLTNQQTILPVNVLPPARTLPVSVFFNGQTGKYALARLITSTRFDQTDQRYLETTTRDLLLAIDWNGLSAIVSGRILLSESQKPATLVWLLAVAYDSHDQIIGYRRWESSAPLQPGASLTFSLPVYSLGPEIDHIETLVEARP
jgi:LysM repeat protein